MKALILAGGYGTRLRPISCTRPKLLFPIANRSLLDLTLERLSENGIDEAILAVNFMSDSLETVFGSKRHGIKLKYSRDSLPSSNSRGLSKGALGTGGPIKKAEKLLGRQEPFLVLNGDILTNTNYLDIMEKHETNEGIATIALRRVEDPSRFGVVKLAIDGKIMAFVEKPSEETLAGNLINAGIYVLEPEIFDYIPEGKKCSIEREVFPELAKEGELFGREIGGVWIDIGKAADFIGANKIWLEAEMEKSNISPRTKLEKATIEEAVAVDDGVSVGKESIIGPNVALGKDVLVGNRVRIKDSIILPRTTILDLSTVKGSIIGEGVSIGTKVKIGEGCLIGDNTIIEDNIFISQDVKICPSKRVSESIISSQCII